MTVLKVITSKAAMKCKQRVVNAHAVNPKGVMNPDNHTEVHLAVVQA
jgi:hypothetical protein